MSWSCKGCGYLGGCLCPAAPPTAAWDIRGKEPVLVVAPESPELKFSPAAEAHLDALEAASPEPRCQYAGSFCGDTGCDVHGLGAGPPSPEPMPEGKMDHAWFCPGCGLRDETNHGIDDDGTCSSCGADCCTWNSLHGHLCEYGWHIVDEASAKVLAEMGELPIGLLELARRSPKRLVTWPRVAAAFQAELARRAAKGSNT